MFTSSSQTANVSKRKGWILDAYPSGEGEMAVWMISETGERILFTDKYQPSIYVSSADGEVENVIAKLYNNENIACWRFAYKYAQPTDQEKSRVIELRLKDCR